MRMRKYSRISNQMFVSYALSILSFALGIILIPFLTRKLTVHDFGIYAIIYSFFMFMTVVLYLGLPLYIVTKFPNLKRQKQIRIFASIFFLQTFIILIIAGVMLLPWVKGLVLTLLGIKEYAKEYLLSIIIIILNTIISLFTYYMNARREIERGAFMGFIQSNLWILVAIASYLLFGVCTINSILMSWIIGLLATFLLCLWLEKTTFHEFFAKRLRIDYTYLWGALVFSLPLVGYSIFSWLLSNFDKYLINYFLNADEVGYFSLAFSISFFLISNPAIISIILYPYIAKVYNSGKNYTLLLSVNVKYCMMLILPLAAGAILLRYEIITSLSGVKYMESAGSLAILSFFSIISVASIIFCNCLMLMDRTIHLSIIYLVGFIINILLDILLIPLLGIEGAAYAKVLASFVILVGTYLYIRKGIIIDWQIVSFHKILVSTIIMCLAVGYIHPSNILTKIGTILLGGLVYFAILLAMKFFSRSELVILSKIYLLKPFKNFFS